MATKQKSGLYRTKIKIGVDENGKDIVKWISGKTKRELEEARRQAEEYYITGTGLLEDRLFGDYAAEWYKVRKAPFVSPSSQVNYRTILNLHVLPAFGDRNLRAIQPVELQKFVNRFRGKSRSQITLVISVLNGVYSAALTDRLVARNPMQGIRRPEDTPPEEKRALTEDERRRFRALFSTHSHGRYLAVMFYTGMRPGEVRGLEWGDFDWEEELIHVQRDIDYKSKENPVGDLKNNAADRYVPIPEELSVLLKPFAGNYYDFLFQGVDGKPLAQVTAIRMWIELMRDAGLATPIPPEEAKYGKWDIRSKWKTAITPHAMRHNFITMCWEAGMDVLLVMKIVGHADYQTTMNIYTHLSRKHLDKAKAKMNEMFAL